MKSNCTELEELNARAIPTEYGVVVISSLDGAISSSSPFLERADDFATGACAQCAPDVEVDVVGN